MKNLILISILMFSITDAHSQKSMPGFYINVENDTIETQIRIRKGVFGQTTNDFIDEVEVGDSLTGFKKFGPDDIKGYGFISGSNNVFLLSKPIKNGSKKFLAPFYIGPKSSLYQYGFRSSGGGAIASQQTFYTFEKSDGSYLYLRDILNKKFKAELKEFYKDNTEVQQLIDTKLKYWLDMKKDLMEILIAANK